MTNRKTPINLIESNIERLEKMIGFNTIYRYIWSGDDYKTYCISFDVDTKTYKVLYLPSIVDGQVSNYKFPFSREINDFLNNFEKIES